MRAIKISGPEKIKINSVKSVPLKKWEVRIAVANAAVCGSDLKLIHNATSLSLIPGHEFSGAIIETSIEAMDTFKFGDKVTAFPMISCLKCKYCLEKNFRDCALKKSLGFQLPGAFSEEIVIDSRFVINLENGLSYEQGALVEHLCCGYRLAKEIMSLKLPINSHIVLLGDGPIALANIQMLKIFNYNNITVIGKHFIRMNLAYKLGAKKIFDFKQSDTFINLFISEKIDVCIYASSAEKTLNLICPFIRFKGVIFPQVRIKELNTLEILKKLKIIYGKAFTYEFEDFSIVMKLMKNSKINTELLISKRVELEYYAESFSILKKNKFACKTIIYFKNFFEIMNKYKAQNT